MFMSLFTVLNNHKNYKNGGAYWNRGAYLQKHILWGALIGRRALNRIITVSPPWVSANLTILVDKKYATFKGRFNPSLNTIARSERNTKVLIQLCLEFLCVLTDYQCFCQGPASQLPTLVLKLLLALCCIWPCGCRLNSCEVPFVNKNSKHEKVITQTTSKQNSLSEFISKAVSDGKISDLNF